MLRKSILALAAILLVAGPAGATTLVKMDFGDLAEQADMIVTGTVTDLQGTWDDSGRFVHTLVTLQVDRYIQGSGPAQIELRTPGGQVDGVATKVHGAPSFAIGERVFAFLTTWEDGGLKVLGYVQGKSRLVTEADGRVRLQGGVPNGLSLDAAVREIKQGGSDMVPLRPAR